MAFSTKDSSPKPLTKGVFMLSLDTELAWGRRDGLYREFHERKREVTWALLELLDRYELKATWATVGHLFLDECHEVEGEKHPEIVKPQYDWYPHDWFDVDPSSNRIREPLWYGRDILEKIRSAKAPQEIGCHTFSHIIVNDPGCSDDCFDSELKECLRLAQCDGIKLNSFVYPRNKVGKVESLKRNGFTNYRGRDQAWYYRVPLRLRNLAMVFDHLCIPFASPVHPINENGIINIPGSTAYPHRIGWGKRVPIRFRVWKAKNTIRLAQMNNGIFHLWFHPFNLASDPSGLLRGLDEIFKFVRRECDRGKLENLTMGEVAARCSIE